jgi:hypothetical protein
MDLSHSPKRAGNYQNLRRPAWILLFESEPSGRKLAFDPCRLAGKLRGNRLGFQFFLAAGTMRKLVEPNHVKGLVAKMALSRPLVTTLWTVRQNGLKVIHGSTVQA